MKKILLFVLFVSMVGALSACGNKTPLEEKEEYVREAEVTENITENITENVTDSVADSAADNITDDVVEQEPEEVKEPSQAADKPQILSLQETRNARYEEINDSGKMLMISEFNYMTFWEGAENYSVMDRTLSEMAGMITRSQEDEADNILSFAQEITDVNSEDFETQISTVDVQVRRADSVVVSYLTDSYANHGFIEDFRGMWGSNYDTQTGQELVLTDVIKDMTRIPELVEKELNSHLWSGEFWSETIIQDYFAYTPLDGIRWTLDYNGVTFYFGDGELSEPGNGEQTATISFAEYPELFEEKYISVPDAYIVRLPMDSSFFTDLDEDGSLEELNVTGFNDGEGRFYSDFGIYTDTDGYYHYEEFFAYRFNPYYIKASDGKHYLYLFCEKSDTENRQMMLIVFDVTGGQFVRVGEMNVAPAYIPTDSFVLPLNPDYLLLDNHDSQEQDFGVYMVGETGMPVKK